MQHDQRDDEQGGTGHQVGEQCRFDILARIGADCGKSKQRGGRGAGPGQHEQPAAHEAGHQPGQSAQQQHADNGDVEGGYAQSLHITTLPIDRRLRRLRKLQIGHAD